VRLNFSVCTLTFRLDEASDFPKEHFPCCAKCCSQERLSEGPPLPLLDMPNAWREMLFPSLSSALPSFPKERPDWNAPEPNDNAGAKENSTWGFEPVLVVRERCALLALARAYPQTPTQMGHFVQVDGGATDVFQSLCSKSLESQNLPSRSFKRLLFLLGSASSVACISVF
jgi:hypothetical protein